MSIFQKIGLKLHKSGLLNPPFHLKNYRFLRLSILFLLDISAFSLCYWIALWLRLDQDFSNAFMSLYWLSLPILIFCTGSVFIWTGMYRQVWRYANFDSAILVSKATAITIFIFSTLTFLLPLKVALPRSVPLILWPLATILLTGLRFSWRMWANFQLSLQQSVRPKCFVYGAGAAGELFARSTFTNPNFPYEIAGFIDDDPNKKNKVLHNKKILGSGSELNQLSEKYNAKTVIIAMHQASGKTIRDIVTLCHTNKLNPLIMPDMASSLGDQVFKPRSVDIKDLLKRHARDQDIASVKHFFENKTVFVSGAGGSIGSEICRQILQSIPKILIIMDQSEFNLYQIDLELKEWLNIHKQNIRVISVLGSSAEGSLVEQIFKQYNPDFVLHAAAYKHVPLIEDNPIEGIINNLGCTKTLADLAEKYKVKKFLLISSDKAVRPTNVMGATKRACEMYIQAKAEISETTAFCAVRFGNVLGSSGSVVPRFMKQIESGGPVTVTHPDVTRYFMLTSEAVSLVLQSIILARGSEIFVLNMGDSIRIYDMAKHLIRLAGKEPGKDIEIIFTGLRPGEKLFEELILDGSESHTLHGDLFVTHPDIFDRDSIVEQYELLLMEAQTRQSNISVVRKLWKLIDWNHRIKDESKLDIEAENLRSKSTPTIH